MTVSFVLLAWALVAFSLAPLVGRRLAQDPPAEPASRPLSVSRPLAAPRPLAVIPAAAVPAARRLQLVPVDAHPDCPVCRSVARQSFAPQNRQ